MPKMKSLKECVFCKKNVYRLAARGLCASCYYREQRNGTPEYVKVRKPCSVEGCDNLSRSKGYCGKHLSRFNKHGVVEHRRFDKWGHASKHALAHTYYHMRRTYTGEIDKTWLDDFWQFVEDVGERPSPRHKMRRIDPSLPYAKGNVIWSASEIERFGDDREESAAYARAYRAANPRLYRDQHLRKKYGKSLEWYEEVLTSQDGVCAICREPETAIDRLSGLPRNLAVDHCHSRGHVRGLLCSKCNTALGAFKDDPVRLRAAISYLELHA